MREIKFRAWDAQRNIMLSLDQVIVVFWPELRACAYDQDGRQLTLPLMQYTGIKDRKGVGIYEGDILRLKKGRLGAHNVSVIFKSPMFKMEGNNSVFHDWALQVGEVIGNIYENPELLGRTL